MTINLKLNCLKKWGNLYYWPLPINAEAEFEFRYVHVLKWFIFIINRRALVPTLERILANLIFKKYRISSKTVRNTPSVGWGGVWYTCWKVSTFESKPHLTGWLKLNELMGRVSPVWPIKLTIVVMLSKLWIIWTGEKIEKPKQSFEKSTREVKRRGERANHAVVYDRKKGGYTWIFF